jgi:outer membrane protein
MRAYSLSIVSAFVAALLLTAGAGGAFADEVKIGVIDSQRIFREYQEAKDAETIFQGEMQQWQDEIEAMEREILSKREKIRSQQLLLSQDKLDELQGELEQLSMEYERKRSEILDPTNGLAVRRNQELSQPINDQITLVVERLGAEGGFDLIVDSATINVVFMSPDIDLTDKVLVELDKAGN